VIENSVIGEKTTIENLVIKDSLIGQKVQLEGESKRFFVGDNSILKND